MIENPRNLNVVSPAEYRISVVGYLEESYSDRLCGLSIQNTEPDQKTGKPVAMATITIMQRGCRRMTWVSLREILAVGVSILRLVGARSAQSSTKVFLEPFSEIILPC